MTEGALHLLHMGDPARGQNAREDRINTGGGERAAYVLGKWAIDDRGSHTPARRQNFHRSRRVRSKRATAESIDADKLNAPSERARSACSAGPNQPSSIRSASASFSTTRCEPSRASTSHWARSPGTSSL